MHMVLMAANASRIMQETKVGKEIILIIIKGCQGCIQIYMLVIQQVCFYTIYC